FACIVLDVISVVAAASLNARQHHARAAIGALLNYPPFFGALWLLSMFRAVDETSALSLFCLSSAARALYFYLSSTDLFRSRQSALQPTSAVMVQPPLNLLLFRADQL